MSASLLLAFAAAPAYAQSRPDTLSIYVNFLGSRYAAESCKAVDAKLEPGFQTNFAVVATRASQAIAANTPQMSEQQRSAAATAMKSRLQRMVTEMVRKDGCGSEKVQHT